MYVFSPSAKQSPVCTAIDTPVQRLIGHYFTSAVCACAHLRWVCIFSKQMDSGGESNQENSLLIQMLAQKPMRDAEFIDRIRELLFFEWLEASRRHQPSTSRSPKTAANKCGSVQPMVVPVFAIKLFCKRILPIFQMSGQMRKIINAKSIQNYYQY